jgi:hypothetical protein
MPHATHSLLRMRRVVKGFSCLCGGGDGRVAIRLDDEDMADPHWPWRTQRQQQRGHERQHREQLLRDIERRPREEEPTRRTGRSPSMARPAAPSGASGHRGRGARPHWLMKFAPGIFERIESDVSLEIHMAAEDGRGRGVW